jgi:hypothetical protein
MEARCERSGESSGSYGNLESCWWAGIQFGRIDEQDREKWTKGESGVGGKAAAINAVEG